MAYTIKYGQVETEPYVMMTHTYTKDITGRHLVVKRRSCRKPE